MKLATTSETTTMKLAKASKTDLKAAMDINYTLESISNQWEPVIPATLNNNSEEDPEPFDIEDGNQCRRVLKHLIGLADRSKLARVVFGMAVLLDPVNKVIDESADSLEFHPQREKDEKDAARWRYVSQFMCLDDVGDDTYVLGLVVDSEGMTAAVQPHASRLHAERRKFKWGVPNPQRKLQPVGLDEAIDAAITTEAEDTSWVEWQAASEAATNRQPLTDAQITQCMDDSGWPPEMFHEFFKSKMAEFARAIERAHGIGTTTKESAS